MSQFIVQCLNPYRKPDCKAGRITTTEDFKHLARKVRGPGGDGRGRRGGINSQYLGSNRKYRGNISQYLGIVATVWSILGNKSQYLGNNRKYWGNIWE